MVGMTILANIEPIFLLSVWKPITIAVGLVIWARIVTLIDDDLVYLAEPRHIWNGSQITVGIAGFSAWLLVPQFWIGLLVCLVATGSSIGCYAHYRNNRVPLTARWTIRSFLSPPGWDQAQRIWAKHAESFQVMDPDGNLRESPTKKQPFARSHCTFEQLIGYALAHRSEHILVKTSSQKASVILEIDGIGYPQPRLEPAAAARLISYIKHLADLDVTDRRRRLNGHVQLITVDGRQHNLDLTTFGSLRGLELSIDINHPARPKLTMNQLGLLPSQKEQLIASLNEKNGVVLVTTQPGQGRTTILQSLLRRHDPNTEHITVLEENNDFAIESVHHHRFISGDSDTQRTEQVSHLLDEKPDVLLVEQLAKMGAASLLADAARHTRIYAAAPHSDTFEALRWWIRYVGNAHTAADSLGTIFAGQLLRKLCTTCRQSYLPHADTLKKLNLSVNRISHLYRHDGRVKTKHKTELCPDCLGLGYRGRIGIFEVLILDEHGRQLVAVRDFEQLRIHMRQQKFVLLQEAALARVIEGTTSIGELTRVFGHQSSPATTESSTPVSNDI